MIRPGQIRAGVRVQIGDEEFRIVKLPMRAYDGTLYQLCGWNGELWAPLSNWAGTEALARYLNEQGAEITRRP